MKKKKYFIAVVNHLDDSAQPKYFNPIKQGKRNNPYRSFTTSIEEAKLFKSIKKCINTFICTDLEFISPYDNKASEMIGIVTKNSTIEIHDTHGNEELCISIPTVIDNLIKTAEMHTKQIKLKSEIRNELRNVINEISNTENKQTKKIVNDAITKCVENGKPLTDLIYPTLIKKIIKANTK